MTQLVCSQTFTNVAGLFSFQANNSSLKAKTHRFEILEVLTESPHHSAGTCRVRSREAFCRMGRSFVTQLPPTPSSNRPTKGAGLKDPPLQVLEEMGDFLAGF